MLSQQRVELLRSVGVEIFHDEVWVGEVGTPGRHPEPLLDTVRSVGINLTAEEWMSIIGAYGDNHIGGCCGNLGAVQDIVTSAGIEEGVLSSANLLEVGRLLRSHDGFDEYDECDDETFQRYIENWNGFGPWEKLGTVFNGVEPALKPRDFVPYKRLDPNGNEIKEDPEIAAVRLLNDLLGRRRWMDVFEVRDTDKDQHNAAVMLMRARMLEPLRALLAIIEADNFIFQGFAVIENATKKPCSNYLGPCIYSTMKDAEELVELTRRADTDFVNRVSIVPVRISVQEGMVFE